MLYNLLTTTAGKTREVSIAEASVYALLGFAIVFLGIAFLILVVWLVGKGMDKAKGISAKPKAKVDKVETAPAPQTILEEALDEETVAVITAALMAYYQQTNPKCEFTVKRIKRI